MTTYTYIYSRVCVFIYNDIMFRHEKQLIFVL